MCLINSNIIETENKEVKRNSDITYEERCKIEFMVKKKYTMQEMAEELGRNKSIISREINRHCEEKWDYNTGICKKVYSAAVAQGKYEYSKKKAGRKCKLSRALKQFIEDKILKEKWSPEEVAGYIKVNNIKFEIQPSFQIIYYWIEKGKLNISPLDLVHKAKLEKKGKKEEKTEKKPKHPEKSIHNRPKEIDENKEFGHWELDCVEGSKDSKKTYMTLLERMTKKYIVVEMKEMMCMKRMVFSFSFLLFVSGINAQITLEECQRKTQENYPLVHQYGLVEKTKEYNLENAAKGYLPQFALSAKASYQSEVTEIPVKLPGVDLKGLPKDQYQVMLELQQKIWDGGGIRTQKKQTTAEAEIEKEKLNVDMYALNSRVNDLYFGILLLDEQLKQNALLQDELERNYRQITAYVENGIANQADLDAVKVEQLNTKQKRVELVSSRMAYLKMLSLLVGEKLSQETVLEKPVPQDEISAVSEIRRPELSLFNAQGVGLQVQEKALNVRHLPQFGLFVQGAYGNPGLNMLKNEFSPYYIAGVRLSWNFGSLYTLKNDRKVIENKRRQLDNNRDVFLFNTRLEMTQQDQAIQSLEKQMQDDDEIIRLRTNIRKSAEAKVANGTLTVTEMLRELTNESLARQSKALHEIQRLMGIYQLKYTTND